MISSLNSIYKPNSLILTCNKTDSDEDGIADYYDPEPLYKNDADADLKADVEKLKEKFLIDK